jgi:hypothetical protein
MVQAYSYIRTRGWLQEGASGMTPASQQMQLRKAGVPRDQIHRDVGTTSTQERGLAPTFMEVGSPKQGWRKGSCNRKAYGC